MKKDFIWNTLGFGIYCFAYSILLIIVTRICGLETAGVFSLLYATANLISQVALYGGKTYHVTDKHGKKYVGTYLITRVISSIVAIVAILILSLIFKYSLDITIVFCSICLTKVVDAISDSYHGILQINKKLYIVGISLLLKTTTSIIVFSLILIFTKSLIYASLSLVLVAIIFLIFFDYIYAKNITKIKYELNREKFKIILKDCFYLFGGNLILTYLVNIPKYILSEFVTDGEQGIFAILIMPAFVVATFSGFVIQPFLVELTEDFDKNINLYKKKVLNICKLIFLIFVFVLIVGCLIGLPVMSFIFGTDLTSYKLELVVTIVSSLVYTISSFIFTNLTLLRKVKSLLYLNIVVAILGNIVTYIMINNFDLFGAYLGFFGIVLIQLALFLIYYYIQLLKVNKN